MRAYRYPAGSVRRRLLIVLDRGALRRAAPLRRRPAGRRAIRCRRRSGGSPHIGADPAAAPGPGVPITVVDSGVDPTNPEFAGRPNTTFLNDQTVDGPGEYHGTAVASLAVAAANGVGIVGVYPQAAFQSFDASPVGADHRHDRRAGDRRRRRSTARA